MFTRIYSANTRHASPLPRILISHQIEFCIFSFYYLQLSSDNSLLTNYKNCMYYIVIRYIVCRYSALRYIYLTKGSDMEDKSISKHLTPDRIDLLHPAGPGHTQTWLRCDAGSRADQPGHAPVSPGHTLWRI